MHHTDMWPIVAAERPPEFVADAAPQPGAAFHSARQVAGLEWQAELERRAFEADAACWRARLEDSFSLADAADAEAAVAVAVGARQGAGLVSVSTTDTRSGRRNETGRVRLLKAQREARAGAAGVFLPPADKDAQRVRHLRRAVGFSARAHGVSQRGHRTDDCLMLTLTYHDASDWRPEHVSGCIKAMREWFRRQGLPMRYVWVAELQKRGAIHYHIALFVPRGMRVPYPDERGWWRHGSTNLERARNAVPYLMKYLSKGSTNDGCWRLPLGARMYGVGGLDHSLRRARRWLGLPGFVRANSDIHDAWTRAVGGGWKAPDGTHYASEYVRCRVGGLEAFQRVASHARPSLVACFDCEPSGPFSWLARGIQ